MFPTPLPTKLLIALLLLSGVTFSGYRYGRHVGSMELDAYKGQVNTATDKQTIANLEEQRAKEQALDKFASLLEERHTNAQTKIDSLYTSNLQLASMSGYFGESGGYASMPADSTTSADSEDLSTCRDESARYKLAAVEKAKIADVNAEAFLVCKDWALGVADALNNLGGK